jgi:hypothetical protein
MSKLYVDQVDPKTATTLTLGTSGDTITVPSGATFNVAGTLQSGGVSVANTPAWKAGISSQSLSYNTATKIDYDNEITDTDSAYDTTNKRFTVPSGKGGTYIIHAFYRTGTGTDINSFDLFVYKNGSTLENSEEMDAFTMSYSYNTVQATGMVTLSASDYIEIYAKQSDDNSTNTIGYSNEGRFWGYKLIGV